MALRKVPLLAYVMLALAIVSTALLGAVALYDRQRLDERSSAELLQKVKGTADGLALSMVLPIWNFDFEQVDGMLDSLMADPGIRGIWIRLEDKQKSQFIRGRDADGQALRLPQPPRAEPGLLEERAIRHGGDLIGKVSVYGDPGPKNALLAAEFRRHLLVIAALDLGLIGLLYLFLWKSLLRPLKAIEDYAHAVASGGGGAELAIQSDLEEIDRLAASVRTMVRLLDERFQSLQSSERHLRETQKMESIGQLAGGVAHDFNNILQLVISCAELARLDLAPGHPALAELDSILEGGRRGSKLVKQLLQFSRRQVMEPRLLSLDRSVNDMSGMLRRLLGEAVRLELRSRPGIGLVRMDPALFEQLLMNLCLNARDAMPQGGPILVEVSAATLTAHEAQAHSVSAGGAFMVLSVSDKGEGIAPDNLAHIFEPFFTTKALGKGTGLGLATCFGIVAQAGGFISVDSQLGQGSSFKVWLPRVEGPDPLPAEPEQGPREARLAHESLLLAEDDPDIRMTLERLLRAQGYRVTAVADARQGLQAAESASFDVLISDLVMPDMAGLEFSRRLRERQKSLKVLYISGYSADLAGQALTLGPDDAFLSKPFSGELLVQKLRGLLDPV